MGLILDFVPNHMGIAAGLNDWWQDVLENGPVLALRRLLRHRLAAAQAGARRTRCCCRSSATSTASCSRTASSQLRLTDGAFTVWYYDLPLPIAPPTYAMILRAALPALGRRSTPEESITCWNIRALLAAFERLPADRARSGSDRRAVRETDGRQAPPRRICSTARRRSRSAIEAAVRDLQRHAR